MDHINLDQYGLHVINFSCIYDKAYKNVVKDLILYEKYTDLNVRSQDTKRIYYYYMIKQICDTIKDVQTTNRVVIFYSPKDIKTEFKQCKNKRTRKGSERDTRDEFILFMSRFFKHAKSMLPVKMFLSDVRFNTFVQYYNTNKGKYTDIVNKLRQKHDTSRRNMEKLRKFTGKYKLNFITNEYLNNIKIKCSMYK